MPFGLDFDPGACMGCGACVGSCPKKCIRMVTDAHGFAMPSVDTKKCKSCGRCHLVCPVYNPPEPPEEKPDVLACPSQCGIAQVMRLLCAQIIAKGGVVFAPRLTGHTVAIGCAQTMEELASLEFSGRLVGSVGDSVSQTRDFLTSGVPVLYYAPPCQIAALRNTLRAECEGLICASSICRGAHSPLALAAYLDSLEIAHGSPAIKLTYDIADAYGSYATAVFESGVFYRAPRETDPFLCACGGGLCLRAACAGCAIRQRGCDLLLGECAGRALPGFFKPLRKKPAVPLLQVCTERGGQFLYPYLRSGQLAVLGLRTDSAGRLRGVLPRLSLSRRCYSFYAGLGARPFGELLTEARRFNRQRAAIHTIIKSAQGAFRRLWAVIQGVKHS